MRISERDVRSGIDGSCEGDTWNACLDTRFWCLKREKSRDQRFPVTSKRRLLCFFFFFNEQKTVIIYSKIVYCFYGLDFFKV